MLIETTSIGQAIGAICDKQADLLRSHIDALRGCSEHVVLCDTGVFGSIGRYLQLGVPAIQWHSVLLYRANYKGLFAPHFKSTIGAVSESDGYVPWRPVTVALLYWQFVETMLEPDVPSVRYYRTDFAGRVISDLEVGDWRSSTWSRERVGACGCVRIHRRNHGGVRAYDPTGRTGRVETYASHDCLSDAG